jgi:hypothetical protein
MSTLVLHQTGRAPGDASPVMQGLGRSWVLVAGFALAFPVVFYLMLLAVLMIEYGHLPNYLTFYDWFENVQRIIASTKSVADMVPIILDEWLIETGFINYDYGHGVAEWSLSIIPHKFAILSVAGALIGLNVALLLGQQGVGTWSQQFFRMGRFGILTGIGALCAGVTNATVFSVVHCATPSWVGSLAVLGFDSYDVFPLEPYGPLISFAGLAALAVSAWLIARDDRSEKTAAGGLRPLRQVA